MRRERPARREVVHARHDEPGRDLGPAVAQHPEAGILHQLHAAIEAGVELVVAGHRPDAERRAQPSELGQQPLDVRGVAVDEIADDRDEVRTKRVDLGDPALEPASAE